LSTPIVTGALTSLAIFLALLSQHKFKVPDIEEVLCRTGIRALSAEENNTLQIKINQAGLNTSPQLIQGTRVVLAGVIILLTLFLTLSSPNALILLLLAPILYYFPILKINKKIKTRQTQIKQTLSEFTLLLSTTLTAGTNLQSGIRIAANAIDGPLKDEINNALRSYGAGQPFSEALLDMCRRTDIDELSSLVQTLIQIHDKGAPISETMKAYSTQMRTTKKFATMEQAGKLSVSMLFPIIIFMLLPFLAVVLYPAGHAISNAF